jgi:REP element-mobilizing transposase RayT
MARPLRIEKAGGWYHVAARGNERKPIYRDERDRGHFLELIEEMVLRFRVHLYCYVLMDNHYHLLLELTETNLSRAAQWLNVSYSVWFNRRRRRSGHLFQGRFKSVTVDRDAWALSLSRYLHLNPIRIGWGHLNPIRIKALGLSKTDRQTQHAGLSPAPNAQEVRRRMEMLKRYRWSSYRAYIGLVQAPRWLECQTVLDLGGGAKAQQRQRYQDYVEEAVRREGLEQSPWESVREQVVLGGAQFLKQLKKHISGDKQEQRGARRLIAVTRELKGDQNRRSERGPFSWRPCSSGPSISSLLASSPSLPNRFTSIGERAKTSALLLSTITASYPGHFRIACFGTLSRRP